MKMWQIDESGEIDICVDGAEYGQKNIARLRELLPAVRGLRDEIQRRVTAGLPAWAICEPHTYGILARFARMTGGVCYKESRIVKWEGIR